MTDQPQPNRDQDTWAGPVNRLAVGAIPSGANSLNVGGRRLTGPLQGFGQLWQRTYRIALGQEPLSPQQAVQLWKEKLPQLMPANNRFYPSLSGVKPGEVVLINSEMPVLMPGGMPLDTGVLVLYADDLQFTVMTPEGHPEAGFNTFSAFEENGMVYAQIQSLARTGDPVYELGYILLNFASTHDAIWIHVLQHLAAQFGSQAEVMVEKTLVDPKRQWSRAGNVWHNAAIRTALNIPVRLWNSLVRRGKKA